MSSQIPVDPFLDLLRNENAKKARGQKNPFAGNPSITDNEFFNPLENKGYSEVLQQMSKTHQTTTEETAKTPTLSDLLNTAKNETRNIFDNIGTLKRLASNAADDKQTDSARDFFQRDFFETVGKIETAAGKMNWNGMVISEGDQNYKITQTSFNFAAEKTSSTQGTQNIIQSGNYNIEADGVYTLAKGYSGIVEVSAQNVKITQENPSTPLKDVSIFGSQKGHANLWIENLNVENSANHRDSVIKFHGEGNTLSFKGNNFIKTAWSESSIIHVGNGLTLNGKDHAALNIDVFGKGDRTSPSAAVIGSNPSEVSTGDINIKNSIINITRETDLGGAAIGSASHHHADNTPQSSIGDINIQDSTINVKVGGVGANVPHRTIGDINIEDSTINVKVDDTRGGAGIGSGVNAKCGDINIDNSIINVDVKSGAAIGAGAGNASTGDIFIGRGAELNVVSRNGAGIGTGFSFFEEESFFGTVGDINIDNNAKINASSIGLGKNDPQAALGKIGNINYTNVSLSNMKIFVNEPLMDFINNFRSNQNHNDPFSRPGFLLDDFSTQNQRPSTEIRLGFMHPRFLGTGNLLSPQGRFLNPFDQNMFDSFFGNTSKQNDWLDIVRGASNQNLSSINLLSRRNANIALRVVEGALSQVQREMSNINTYIQRYIQSQSSDNAQNVNDDKTIGNKFPFGNFV